jgi:hypothetical protein
MWKKSTKRSAMRTASWPLCGTFVHVGGGYPPGACREVDGLDGLDGCFVDAAGILVLLSVEQVRCGLPTST